MHLYSSRKTGYRRGSRGSSSNGNKPAVLPSIPSR